MYALHFTLYTSVFANIYPINTLLAKIIGCKEQEKTFKLRVTKTMWKLFKSLESRLFLITKGLV